MEIEITNVELFEVNRGRLLAVATLTFNNALSVTNFKIIQAEGDMFVAMPDWADGKGKHKEVAWPRDKKTYRLIQEAVLEKYWQLKTA